MAHSGTSWPSGDSYKLKARQREVAEQKEDLENMRIAVGTEVMREWNKRYEEVHKDLRK